LVFSPFSKLLVEVGPALAGELAVKDENVAAGGAVGLEGGRGGGEGVGRQEGGQELLVLAVLEVLRAPDVPAVEFELVASVNYPGTLLVG
jgi:hypothetical protein